MRKKKAFSSKCFLHIKKRTSLQLGIIIPCNFKQAFEVVDAKNSNTLWKDAITTEFENIRSYQTFKDMGKVTHVSGYKNIIAHFVFVVEHGLQHKAR
jgi:hypothetical protein